MKLQISVEVGPWQLHDIFCDKNSGPDCGNSPRSHVMLPGTPGTWHTDAWAGGVSGHTGQGKWAR